jgi:hypothetical protein
MPKKANQSTDYLLFWAAGAGGDAAVMGHAGVPMVADEQRHDWGPGEPSG